MQLKLDELIRATEGAHLELPDMEELSEAELDSIRARYVTIAAEARARRRNGGSDMGSPPIDL